MSQYQGHPDQRWGHITYSQHFDDGMILNLFELMKIQKPSYIDLGAHSPITISNTKLLYDRGSRGINIEANPMLIEEFKKYRPEDTNLNIGVAPSPGTMKFFLYSDTSGRNTFSPKEVESLRGVLTVKREIILPVTTLPAIVKNYLGGVYPDFLSCDIEGLDFDVLSQLPGHTDEQDGPKLVCVETRREDTRKMVHMMLGKSYSLYCRMGENLFFVRDDYQQAVY